MLRRECTPHVSAYAAEHNPNYHAMVSSPFGLSFPRRPSPFGIFGNGIFIPPLPPLPFLLYSLTCPSSNLRFHSLHRCSPPLWVDDSVALAVLGHYRCTTLETTQVLGCGIGTRTELAVVSELKTFTETITFRYQQLGNRIRMIGKSDMQAGKSNLFSHTKLSQNVIVN